MIRNSFIIILLLFYCPNYFYSFYHFRKVLWRMSPKEVNQAENNRLHKLNKKTYFVRPTMIYGKKAIVFYSFKKNKLSFIQCTFTKSFKKLHYFTDFKKQLEKKWNKKNQLFGSKGFKSKASWSLKDHIVRLSIEKVKKPYILILKLFPRPDTKPDFRNLYWGMSKKQVFDNEKSKGIILKQLSKNTLWHSGHISSEIKLLGMNASLIYKFKNNNLYIATYWIEEKFENSMKYIKMYKKIKDYLIWKYGKLYKEERKQHSFIAGWILLKHSIVLKLKKDKKYGYSLLIDFYAENNQKEK